MNKHFLAFFTVFLLMTTSADAEEATTSVLSHRGSVQVLRDGQMVPARKDFVLQANDEIVTQKGGTVDVGWAGLWGCRVFEESHVKVSSLVLENQRVGMDRGSMLFRFKKMPAQSNFRLETPVAVAAVRGTVFLGRISPEGTTSIAVASGMVELKPLQGEALKLSAGEAGDVSAQGPAAKRPPTEEERNLLTESESIRTGRKAKGISRRGYVG